MIIEVLDGRYGVYKYRDMNDLPVMNKPCGLYSVTVTKDEVSLVTQEVEDTRYITAEEGYKALRIKGVLTFDLIGIIANISQVLAKNRISIFVISTYDTDYFLLKEQVLEQALEALKTEGYEIEV